MTQDIPWVEWLKKLGACRSYADNADDSVSSRTAWELCTEPHRVAWFAARLGYVRTVEQITAPVTAWLSPQPVAGLDYFKAAEVLAVAVARSYGKPGYWEITEKIKQAVSYEDLHTAMRKLCDE
jgi:hypothetical protein